MVPSFLTISFDELKQYWSIEISNVTNKIQILLNLNICYYLFSKWLGWTEMLGICHRNIIQFKKE